MSQGFFTDRFIAAVDTLTLSRAWDDVTIRFAWVKQRKAQGNMHEALRDLSALAAELSEQENTLKVKCLLKVRKSPIRENPLCVVGKWVGWFGGSRMVAAAVSRRHVEAVDLMDAFLLSVKGEAPSVRSDVRRALCFPHVILLYIQ